MLWTYNMIFYSRFYQELVADRAMRSKDGLSKFSWLTYTYYKSLARVVALATQNS